MKTLLLGMILLLGAAAAGSDADKDGIADAQDRCPAFADPDQKDANADGIGDACQCGDANGDGSVDVSDIVAANAMLVGKNPASPLCDANLAGGCETGDIASINAAIYGSCFPVCARYPTPPAGKTACTGVK
jgi:hypothetical protein